MIGGIFEGEDSSVSLTHGVHHHRTAPDDDDDGDGARRRATTRDGVVDSKTGRGRHRGGTLRLHEESVGTDAGTVSDDVGRDHHEDRRRAGEDR